MVVRKIIERILEVGQTSITITDTDIPSSLVRTYSNDPDLMPVQLVLTGSTLKIDYEAQTTDKYVAVELVKQGLDIIDNLTSTDTDVALSAKQGKVLKDLVDGITPITELAELDDVSAEDPQTGDILKYNGTSEKWEKYNLPVIPLYLGDLGDIVLDSVANGQVLTYNGAYWTNATPQNGAINYSTTEHLIGKWIDGSDLYERTINAGALPNNSTKNVETLTGIDEVVYIEGFITDNGGYMRPLPFPADASNTIRVDINNYVLRIVTYGDWSGYPNCYITIRYTKS